MEIFEIKKHQSSNGGGLEIYFSTSFNIENRILSLGSTLKNGSSGLMNWRVRLHSYNPIKVKVKSVLFFQGRMLMEIEENVGPTYLFEGAFFNSLGLTGDYHLLDREIPKLETGSEIEILSGAYSYVLEIYGTTPAELQDITLSLEDTSGRATRRTYAFNREA